MTSKNEEVSLLCLNYSATFKRGKLMLPLSFCEEYGEQINDRVYLHMPSGEVWHGSYESRTASISGLEKMMDHYFIKPFHFVLLHYTGGRNFKIEIFNHYGVEMNYPPIPILVKKSPMTRGSCSGSDSLIPITPVEIDKLSATLTYSVLNSCRSYYDLVITEHHLANISTPLICKKGCAQLRLDESISSIQLCFDKFMWKIKLYWRRGEVYFDNEWLSFVKAAKLHVGDICVIQKTVNYRKFNLAILEKKNILKFNRNGLQQGKSLMKCCKIVTPCAVQTGSLELPRVFMKEYGKKLKKKVSLLMPDAMLFKVDFCSLNNLLFGLHDVMYTYSITEEYVLFFDYVGRSTFYVSIFDPFCMDISNEMTDKLFLKNVEIHEEVAVIGEVIETESLNLISVDTEVDELLDTLSHDEDRDAALDDFSSFTITLKSSHVDQRGHGVYCPRHMFHIYRSWMNSTVVKLVVGTRSWNVQVHRKDRMCRFGKGWDKFTRQNQYSVGQQLEFIYRNNRTFVVTLLL